MWAFLRVLEEGEAHPRFWAFVMAACLGTGLLLKSLIAIVFPVAAAVIYLFFTRQLFSWATWKRLHVFSGAAIVLLIAAPWHLLATLRNPPYFVFTLHSGPGQYHGFFWFYFINEQLLRFLNLRYPRDYNTVPRLYFWLFQFLWMFPWSVYFPGRSQAFVSGPSIVQGGRDCWRFAGRVRDGVFHVFDDAGILFDAVLSGICAVVGIGDGAGRGLGAARDAGDFRDQCRAGCNDVCTFNLRARTCPRLEISRRR